MSKSPRTWSCPPELPAGSDPAGQASSLPAKGETPASGQPGCAAAPGGSLPEQFGRYRVQRPVGRGGMGSVYLAHDTQLDRPVALKVPHFSPADGTRVLERFLREARAAATIEHPNICPVYDVGAIGGVHFLAMAYVEGRPLSDLLRQATPLPPREAAGLVRKLALALEEAHQRGVIHRDLKPSNIMLNRRGEPVVMDFGLARRGGTGDARLTQAGQVMGTPAYMPPEQVSGDLEAVGPVSDVYSLGVILYELLTGRVPFRGPLASVLAQVLTEQPAPPSTHRPGLDPRLEAVCLKAMTKEPGGRYPSMAAFAAALGEHLEGRCPPPAPAELPAWGAGLTGSAPTGTASTTILPAPPELPAGRGEWGGPTTRAGWRSRRVVLMGGVVALLLLGGALWAALPFLGKSGRSPAQGDGVRASQGKDQADRPLSPAGTGPDGQERVPGKEPGAGTPNRPAAPQREDAPVRVMALAAPVKQLFRTHCLECHGGSKTNAGVKILDHDRLLARKKVVPSKPEESSLYRLVTARDDSVMPPPGQPRLSPENIDLVRRWIAAGAPPFPRDAAVPQEAARDPAFREVAGVDYVLKKILAHVRTLPQEDRRYVRYFSINHILTAGATAAELEQQRQALAKAVNHLSWESRLVRPRPVDGPVNTIYAIDLRELGWQRQPFERRQGKRSLGQSPVNLFDLVLLEYPYGILYEDSDTFNQLSQEFLAPAGQVRPIPYMRADWLVSVATQPPLYEDFLGLPRTLTELESRLGVVTRDNQEHGLARRAGLAVSGVSRNNRVVERQPAQHGAYWQSFDFRTGTGRENIFQDPLQLHPSGGEVIFNLPNGLQGYFVVDGRGNRLEAAPTDIVTDRFAEDKVVRNGLSCMRCHDAGLKGFTDAIRPVLERLPGSPGFDRNLALRLYPGQAEMDGHVKRDGERFLRAVERVLGKPQGQEPLAPVSRQFLEGPLHLGNAAGELGHTDPAGLAALFRTPAFTGLGLMPLTAQGAVRRDAWESTYDRVVRGLGLGIPVVPLDGLTRRDYPVSVPPFEVELKTNRKGQVFEPGDVLEVVVANRSGKPLYIELVGTGIRGNKVLLVSNDTVLPPGETYRWTSGKPIGRLEGKEQITLFASDIPFPPGELLRGQGVADRVVHPFYEVNPRSKSPGAGFDPSRLVKKTIEIETR